MAEKLSEKHHAPVTEAAIRYLIIRAGSDPVAQAVADDARKVRFGLRAARDASEDAVDNSRASTAAVLLADSRVDTTVKVELQAGVDNLLATLPEAVRKSRKAKVFGGKAPSVGMKLTGGESQDQYVVNLLAELQDPFYAPLAPVAAKIDARRTALRTAEAHRKTARTAEATARTALEVAVEDAHRFYNQAEARLTLLFPDDPDFVQSCFLDLRSDTDEQSVEFRKRVLLDVYRARFGAVPRELQSTLKGPEDDAGFAKLVEVFATKGEEEIAGVVGVKKG